MPLPVESGRWLIRWRILSPDISTYPSLALDGLVQIRKEPEPIAFFPLSTMPQEPSRVQLFLLLTMPLAVSINCIANLGLFWYWLGINFHITSSFDARILK
jgi:hypothetical protein